MRATDLIGRKRDGGTLEEAELSWLVARYLDGSVSDGQMAALLMAGLLNGFDDDEARALTRILVASGDTMDLSTLPGPTVDKHSTGGVGDGTTLLVAPLVASAGTQLVKLSGRGLGHTGGTLDKLESIPGLRTDLEPDELLRIAAEVGCVVAAQSDRLVPADRELYALRDVTGTVGSPALIASSVMSKKLAGGAETIVLDVKAGDGAFMPTAEAAEHLARLCVDIGLQADRRCAAVVTDMDQPLGKGIGNALEVREAVDLLQGPPHGRLAQLSLDLASTLVGMATGADRVTTEAKLRDLWSSGTALETLQRMVAAQGGDPAVCERPTDVLPAAPVTAEVTAAEAGFVRALPARAVGELSGWLGAGRARKGEPVDPAVGIALVAEVGDPVAEGQALAVIHARDETRADEAARRLRSLFTIAEDPPAARPTVLSRVGGVPG